MVLKFSRPELNRVSLERGEIKRRLKLDEIEMWEDAIEGD
jgi:hypothetical protein